MARWAALATLIFATGCARPPGRAPTPPVAAPAAPAPGFAAPSAAQSAASAAAAAAALPLPVLGPPRTPSSWDELRLQAAQRLVAANPDTSYVAAPPSVLLAIPMLEIELNRDGTVRHITVLREPTQAQDTTLLAIAAVRRAAPFGDVSRLKKPWKFTEVFLFDDQRRFMPRTLDR